MVVSDGKWKSFECFVTLSVSVLRFRAKQSAHVTSTSKER